MRPAAGYNNHRTVIPESGDCRPFKLPVFAAATLSTPRHGDAVVHDDYRPTWPHLGYQAIVCKCSSEHKNAIAGQQEDAALPS
jgi:hypothetical protein